MIKHKTSSASLVSIILCLFLFASSAKAQYKDFVRHQTRKKLLEIGFDKRELSITVFGAEEERTARAERKSIVFTDEHVRISDDVYFTSKGLNFQGDLLAYDSIVDSRISADNDKTTIEFYTYTQAESRYARRRIGNITAFSKPLRVSGEDFVRGLIFSVTGLIEVSGEVNKDIISLFGDIHLVTGAVARGDIATISGDVQIEDHASIYGEIFSGKRDYDSRRFRFYREAEFEPGIIFKYNRIDGLQLGGTLNYVDGDSLYPAAEVGLGYAFESKRLRYHARIEQLLWRDRSLRVSAGYFRRLASGDDWLLGDGENSAFVFLATEDFKDYYETEGVTGWVSIQPSREVYLKTGYIYNDTRWYRARQHLWSLFGGSKLFRENFSTVEDPLRSSGISEINDSINGAFFLKVSFESYELNDDIESSGWRISGELEWSNPSFSSDFDYRRYTLQIIRYQNINTNSSLRLRWYHGNSDGYLPMYKRFFLGGLGTLRGYGHKEFIGTRFWLANSEYIVNLPTSYKASLILFWDVAQIANEGKLDETAEIRHNFGIGLDLGGLRISVAKRLDGAKNRDSKMYVRLARAF